MSSDVANNSLNIAAFIVLYYDYALTLPMEFERYWAPGSLNLASGLFFVNRYVALAGHIPIVYQSFVLVPTATYRDEIFDGLTLYHSLLVMILQILTALLLTMRMYALYNRNRYVLGVMIFLVVVAFVVSSWIISVDVTVSQEASLTKIKGKHIAAAWAALLVFDTVVFGLTMYKAHQIGRRHQQPLLHTLFRDGIIYYTVILSINLVNILMWALAPNAHKGITSTLTNVLSVIMISRMMLNLRHPRLMHADETHTAIDGDSPVSSRPWISSVIELEPNSSMHTSFAPSQTEWHRMSDLERLSRPGPELDPLHRPRFALRHSIS